MLEWLSLGAGEQQRWAFRLRSLLNVGPDVIFFEELAMKRCSLYFLIALLTFSSGVLMSLMTTYTSTNSQDLNIAALPLDFPCPPDAFTLKP